MSEDRQSAGADSVAVRLIGLQQGTSLDQLATVLQRLYRGQTLESIRKALDRLPLTLTRAATSEQAGKIRRYLESRGAILEITASDSSGQQETSSRAESQPPADKAGVEGERRAKPRVHPGIRIHPMGVGEILDRAFRLLRQHFLLFFLILLIPQAGFFVIGKLMQIFLGGAAPQSPTVAMGASIGISFFLALLVFMVLQFWAQGALIHAVSETYLGHEASVTGSYGAMRPRLGRLLGTLMFMGFLIALVPALAGIVTAIVLPILAKAGMSKLVLGVLTVTVVVVAVGGFFYLFLSWLLVDKVVVLEGKAWKSALRRSKELMQARTESGLLKGPKNKAGLILLLGFVIGIGIHLVFQVPGFLFQFAMPGSLLGSTIQEVLNVFATSLAAAFTAIAMILFYYDIRLRREGFDLKTLAENL